jgi:DNA-binding Lrp family transcriptional regulator
MADRLKLTIRQKIFWMKLIEHFGYSRRPVHHSTLAKALGLSNSTTYNMLKLLESKGVLDSVYVTPDAPRRRAQGRARIMFVPSDKIAEKVFRPLGGDTDDKEAVRAYVARIIEYWSKDEVYEGNKDEIYSALTVASHDQPSLAPKDELQRGLDECRELKNHIITTIQEQEKFDYDRLIYELSVLMVDTQSSLARCLEIIIVILLCLNKARYKFDAISPLKMLLESPVSKERMNMLVGLAWGLVLANARTRKLFGKIRNAEKDIEVYEESIDKLSQEELTELHKFTREVWHCLNDKVGAVA